MPPTQNMTDDCDFSNESDIPTIVNFMIALGEATDCVDVDSVKEVTDRNVLRISFCWSKEISRQQKCEDIMGCHIIDGGLENTNQRFSFECDEIEFESISMLSSLES